MTPCAHLTEVELAHDRRLDDDATAALVEHVRTCEPCRARAAMLAALAPALAAVPVSARDAAAMRRDRARLLDGARSPDRSRWIVIAGIAIASATAILIVAHGDRRSPATHVTVQPTTARWSRHDERGTTLVRLEEGALDLHVMHDGEPHRLVVSLPDGELDDLGTTFHVAVTVGRTSEVTVREGAVELRLVGQPPVFLVAGEQWSAATTTVVTARAPETASVAASPPSVVAPPKEPAHVRAPPVAPTSGYARAVRLFERGELTAAVTALRSFIVQHGDDARAEDAGYLLVLALHRSGDASVREAARAYLERFPNGFRRAEVEQLAR